MGAEGRILSLCWRPAEDREQYPRGRGHRGLEGKRTRETPEHEGTADTGRKARQELQGGRLCCAEGRTSETNDFEFRTGVSPRDNSAPREHLAVCGPLS